MRSLRPNSQPETVILEFDELRKQSFDKGNSGSSPSMKISLPLAEIRTGSTFSIDLQVFVHPADQLVKMLLGDLEFRIR